MKQTKVLFVYPNRETILRIPMAVSILCASIKNAGHDVSVFDTTFLGKKFKTDIHYSEQKRTVKKSKIEDFIGELDNRSLQEIVQSAINEYSPDLIAVSLLERNYSQAMSVLKEIKKYSNAPVLVGGILPTISPDFVINIDEVDMICLGEGEGAIVDLCNAISQNKDCIDIPNLWIKQNNKIYKNSLRQLIDIDQVPEQDWTPFDSRHLYRAYKGNVYNNGTFEFARGCLKVCSFCVAPQLRKAQSNIGHYHRFKSPERIVQEIENKCNAYDLNLIHFGDTDFLFGMEKQTLETFSMLYKKHIDLPFLIQTSAEAINDEKMRLLKNAGCDNISVGVESGSERIRKQIIHKYVPKKKIVDAFQIGRKYQIRMTANYMLGLPDETEEDIMDSIKLNRELNPPAISVFYFTPFLGTELYDLSLKKGYITGFKVDTNVHKESPLEMPHLPKEKIDELLEFFINDFETYKDEY